MSTKSLSPSASPVLHSPPSPSPLAGFRIAKAAIEIAAIVSAAAAIAADAKAAIEIAVIVLAAAAIAAAAKAAIEIAAIALAATTLAAIVLAAIALAAIALAAIALAAVALAATAIADIAVAAIVPAAIVLARIRSMRSSTTRENKRRMHAFENMSSRNLPSKISSDACTRWR